MKSFRKLINVFFLMWGIIVVNNTYLEGEEKSLAPLQIMEKEYLVLTHNKSFTQKASVVLESYDKNGKKWVKRGNYLIKRDYDKKEEKYAVDILCPPDIKGTKFLVWAYPRISDERWIYLPSLRVIRRISTSDVSGSFIGTNFSYEDVSLRFVDDYTYRLLRSESFNGQECYVIEGIPKMEDTGYSKRIFWVRKDIFTLAKEEFYRKKDNNLWKVEEINDIKKIDGIWTYIKTTMYDLLEGSKTTVIFENLEFNTAIPDKIFTKRFLK